MPDIDYEKLFRSGRLQVESPENHDHREYAVRLLRFYYRDKNEADYPNYKSLLEKYPTITKEELETGVAKRLAVNAEHLRSRKEDLERQIAEHEERAKNVKDELKAVEKDLKESEKEHEDDDGKAKKKSSPKK